jgi:hypothetical protein
MANVISDSIPIIRAAFLASYGLWGGLSVHSRVRLVLLLLVGLWLSLQAIGLFPRSLMETAFPSPHLFFSSNVAFVVSFMGVIIVSSLILSYCALFFVSIGIFSDRHMEALRRSLISSGMPSFLSWAPFSAASFPFSFVNARFLCWLSRLSA